MTKAQLPVLMTLADHPRLAVLLDPDKTTSEHLEQKIMMFEAAGVSCILLGGTYVGEGSAPKLAAAVRRISYLPLILFPGASPPKHSLCENADAFLCPIVLTTKNPWFLTGWHIEASSIVSSSKLTSIPTGYILIGDDPTRISAMTATDSDPVPAHDVKLATNLAQTAAMIGMSLIYLDGGSGAPNPIPVETIRAVRQCVALPLIVGGGLRDVDSVRRTARAGADWVVIGNALEGPADLEFISSLVDAAQW